MLFALSIGPNNSRCCCMGLTPSSCALGHGGDEFFSIRETLWLDRRFLDMTAAANNDVNQQLAERDSIIVDLRAAIADRDRQIAKLPAVRVRQWVLSFPYRIRFLLAFDPALCSAVRGIFVRTIGAGRARRSRARRAPARPHQRSLARRTYRARTQERPAPKRRGRQRDRRQQFIPGELCCDLEGFSLHAKALIEGQDRTGLERLCRYIARAAIASERLSIEPDGRVIYRLRRPSSDGTSAIVFEPLAFLERLAAIVPRPRAQLLTYHGMLAPAAQWRDKIVPGPHAPTESHHGSTEPRAGTSGRPVCSGRPVTSSRPAALGSTDSPAAL